MTTTVVHSSIRLITVEEMQSMPEDGIRRWLLDGVIKEIGQTRRNRIHALTEATVAYELSSWADKKQKPRPCVLSGEAGIILGRNPDTSVGADVAVISSNVMANQSDRTDLLEGIPLLIAEIVSPEDTLETWLEKTRTYKKFGVPLTWIVNPYDRTVGIHRPGQPPIVLNETQDLVCEPELPGFRVPVIQLFDE